MKLEQTECSETSAHKIQTLQNHTKEIIQHSEQGESLKSRTKNCYILSPYTTYEDGTECSETSAHKIQTL